MRPSRRRPQRQTAALFPFIEPIRERLTVHGMRESMPFQSVCFKVSE